ncbi:MAG: DUF349 domain-containing protein [Bacteroidales bacterium]|nr:DUF349 domain-containing protein [Bacteroidales bacterium]
MEELSNNTAAENPQPEMTQEETMQQHPAGETATAPIEELVAETTEPETSAEPTPVAEPVTPVAEPVEATPEEKQPEEITIPEIPEDIYDHFTKEEVVRTLEELVQNEDINQIKRQVSLLKIRFIHLNKEEAEQQRLEKASANAAEPADNNGETEKTDGAEAETEAGPKEEQLSESQLLDNRFHAAFATYKENKQKYIDRQEQQKAENLAAKKNLLDKLKVLIDSEISLKEIYDQFKAIQEEWKAIGPVPQADTTEIWQNYHFYVEKFFDKVRINKELRELDLKKNLESKIALCEKTEALLLEPSIFESFSRLQQYHNDWKEIGPVPEDKKEEIWARFKNASDLINQKRREHYEQMAQEQENNYQAKLALCLRAEEVTKIDFSSMKQMNEAGNIASELLKTWRTIGPAPKQHNDEIWNRFKNTLDNFFER